MCLSITNYVSSLCLSHLYLANLLNTSTRGPVAGRKTEGVLPLSLFLPLSFSNRSRPTPVTVSSPSSQTPTLSDTTGKTTVVSTTWKCNLNGTRGRSSPTVVGVVGVVFRKRERETKKCERRRQSRSIRYRIISFKASIIIILPMRSRFESSLT